MSEGYGLIGPGQSFPPRIAGRYYRPDVMPWGVLATTSANVAMVADRMYAVPYQNPTGILIARLAGSINAGSAAGKLLRFGVALPGSDGLPGALVKDGGPLAADVTGAVSVTFTGIPTASPFVYLLAWSDGAPTMVCYATVVNAPFGYADANALTRRPCLTRDLAFAAFPASLAGTWVYEASVLPILSATDA